MSRYTHWDAPVWAMLLFGLIGLGSLGCLAIAGAQTFPQAPAFILTTDNATFPPNER